MLNSTTAYQAGPARDRPNGGFGTGLNLLVVIIYGALAFLLVAVFVQRALLRIVPKLSKGHTDVGKFAPKSLKADIDDRLQRTLHVAFEPVLLPDDDVRLRWLSSKQECEDEVDDTKERYNYLYRMKAVDDMKKLEDALCRSDESLKRHPFKPVRQHLRDVKSHSSGIMRMVRSSQMKALADAYEHARYKTENFGRREYEKFSEVLSDVLSGVEQKTRKKKSRKQHSQKNTNNSRAEAASLAKNTDIDDARAASESEPLIDEKASRKKH